MKPRRGQYRDDGMRFWRINRGKEVWLTEEEFERYHAKDRARMARFRKRNPDHNKDYYRSNRQAMQDRSRRWAMENVEKRRAMWRRWYDANSEHRKEYERKYNQLPWVQRRMSAHAASRRARMKINDPRVMQAIFSIYDFARRASDAIGVQLHVDHIFPLKPKHGQYSGLHLPCNMRIVTAADNMAKKNKCPLEVAS